MLFHLDLEAENFQNGNMMRDLVDGLWKCLICDYAAKQKQHVRYHIDCKHMSLEYSCQYCNKTCPTKLALTLHVKRMHKN